MRWIPSHAMPCHAPIIYHLSSIIHYPLPRLHSSFLPGLPTWRQRNERKKEAGCCYSYNYLSLAPVRLSTGPSHPLHSLGTYGGGGLGGEEERRQHCCIVGYVRDCESMDVDGDGDGGALIIISHQQSRGKIRLAGRLVGQPAL